MASSSQQQQQSPAVQAVLTALDALYNKPEKEAKDQANSWLQDFQKTPEAWETANTLLLAQDLPIPPRLFASQTFRTKTTFDLDQVPRASLPSLRATLLTALESYTSGPRVIQTQLCLTLSALALQLYEGEDPEWGDNVVPWMVEKFGKDPKSVVTLLEFLTVLPEEITGNHRIPVDNHQYDQRVQTLLVRHRDEVLKVLAMYIQAQGVTPQIQSAILSCLASWLRCGEISVSVLLSTPLFAMSFDALSSDPLFDVAVDVVCDIINETQEIEENMDAIQLIVPRILALRPDLAKAAADDDDDKVRGLCRVFVQAAETYHHLILRHRQEFWPLVEAVSECASYSDLDIVQITFRFWYLLATDLGKISERHQDPTMAPMLDVYKRLLDIIVKHLRFPDNLDTLTGQERDDLRSFRHYMGDTLKDCCHVLGSQPCLARSLSMIQDVLQRGASGSGATVAWQDVEAPLFSMRAMGAEANPRDDDVVPKIIDLIPSLPQHPKLNYAALLVISRYTEWVDHHPDRIPGLLSYISAGFSANDADVMAAASQAMNFLCQDCKRHLVPFLPQLYEFFQQVTESLEPEDLMSISEAIAHIIAGMPPQEASQPLLQFTQPLLQTLHTIAGKGPGATKDELRKAGDRMEQLERFLYILGDRLASAGALSSECSKTCQEVYSVLDQILAQHGTTYFVSERACALIRRALVFFGDAALATLPALLSRMAADFDRTGFPAYVWIVGKTIDGYASTNSDEALRSAMRDAFERVSAKLMSLLERARLQDIADVIDDYVHACSAIVARCPSLILLSPVFAPAFQTAVAALGLYQPGLVSASLDFIRDVVGHEAIQGAPGQPQQTSSASSPAELQAFAGAIRQVVDQHGYSLISILLQGLVTSFEPEDLGTVLTTVRVLCMTFPQQVSAWIEPASETLPTANVSLQDRATFVAGMREALAASSLEGVRATLQKLYAASRKARERARMDRSESFYASEQR